MKTDDIDRLLRGDRPVAPSSDFAARVMREVQREFDGREALRFPWSRLLPGLAACVAVTVVGLFAGAPPIDVEAVAAVVRDTRMLEPLAWMLGCLVLSYMLVRWSTRVV